MIQRRVGTELAGMVQLLGARRGRDDVRAERLCDREARGRDAAADAPDEHPLVLAQVRLRRQHAIGGFEHERERRRRLEVEPGRQRVDLRARDGDQLGVRAVGVLADHRDPAVAVIQARVDHDRVAGSEAVS